MIIEYRIMLDTESRKGTIVFYQDGEQVSSEHIPIKHIHLSENRALDFEKDEEGNIVKVSPSGPKMFTLTMTEE